MTKHVLGGAVLIAISCVHVPGASTQPAPGVCALNAQELGEAVAWAAGGRVRAYDLQSIFRFPDGGAESPARVATPLVRAAWAAARAIEREEDMSGFRPPADACADEVWFIFPVLGDEWAEFDEDGTPFQVQIRRNIYDLGGTTIRASWRRVVPLTAEWRKALGPVPPSDRLVVGAFRRGEPREGDRVELVRFRTIDDGRRGRSQGRIGVIAEGDLARWR